MAPNCHSTHPGAVMLLHSKSIEVFSQTDVLNHIRLLVLSSSLAYFAQVIYLWFIQISIALGMTHS